MQKIRKVFGAFVLLGLTFSADAMKRTAEDAGAVGKEPYIKQSYEVEQSYEAPEFSLSVPVVPLKARLTQEILADWPLSY